MCQMEELWKIRANADTRSSGLAGLWMQPRMLPTGPTKVGSIRRLPSGHPVEEVGIRPERVFVLDRLPPHGFRDRPFRSLPESKISPFQEGVKRFGVVPARGLEPPTCGL